MDLPVTIENIEKNVAEEVTFRALAGFRRGLRRFLSFSESAARQAGITTQQYQAMLAVRASAAQAMTVGELASDLLLAPNGAVQLADRLESLGLLSRDLTSPDRRRVLLRLTPLGKGSVEALARAHRRELLAHRKLLSESLRLLKSLSETE